MVVHGEDFIIAGDGDDFDWLSQKLNEKLDLVQNARLGPGYDGEATVLNSCVMYSDSGLTTRDIQSLQWQNLVFRRRVHRRARVVPSRMRHCTMKSWNLMDRKRTTACQQDCHIWHQTDLTSHSLARSAVVQSERQHVADLTRLKRIGRCLLNTPRVIWEFPLQFEENITMIDGLSDADAAGCPKTGSSTSGGCSRVGQHTLATSSSTQKVVSLSSAKSEYYSMVRCANEAIGLANTIRELGHKAQIRIWTDAAAARGLALRSGSGTIKHMETKNCWLQQKEKNQELKIEKIRGTVNPADRMTKHLDGKRLITLCELLNIKRISFETDD